ncbi:anaphase promoting complex subunit cdc16, partial [Xenotaenia resolanae]
DPQDIYWLAQCLYLTSQYHRASHALRSRKLDKLYGACQYLAARCHYAAKEFQQALDILDAEEPVNKKLLDRSEKDDSGTEAAKEWDMLPSSVSSSICLLRGKIYDAMDNRPLATFSYKEALKLDVYCFEAFDLLTSHHMLTAQEEKDFLDSLPLSQQCTEEEEELLHFLFENKLKKYNKPSDLVVPEMVNGLQDNLDVPVFCFITKEKCSQVSWFAVGCYYLMVGNKNEHARRYLSKATTLERTYGPAWIAYGHSFAVESEHDQAMAAYFTAAQLMKGCHLPMLYIGLEYGLTNNSKLAERFFSQALSIAPEDPKYDQALEYHRQALVLIPQHASTYSAIGYVHSLMGDFESAIDYFHTVRGSLNTPALMKMLNTSETNDLQATPRSEETSLSTLETPASNQEKMMLEPPLRLSLTLECDMYESDVMLDTLSDTST